MILEFFFLAQKGESSTEVASQPSLKGVCGIARDILAIEIGVIVKKNFTGLYVHCRRRYRRR